MLQSIYESKAVQQYPVGMRLAMDERVFRYCKAGKDSALAFWGHGNANRVSVDEVLLPYVVPAGSTEVIISDAVAAAGDYKDGWLLCHRPAGYFNQVYRIKNNTATVGGEVTLTLYNPTAYEMIATFHVYVHKNKYNNIIKLGVDEAGGNGFRTVVCIPLINLVDNEYFWGQTWGPCWGFYSVAEPGVAAYRRDLYFNPGDGSLLTADEIVAAGYGNYGIQRAGVVLPETNVGEGSCFYELQISP